MKENSYYIDIITISKDESGQRIDNFLFNYLKKVPKSMIYRLIRTGKIRINKKRVKPKYKILYNDKIRIPPINRKYKNLYISVRFNKISYIKNNIIYEDDHLLILNKPDNIAVHGGSGINFGVIEGLRALRPNENFLELVHRLDINTSGVLLFAKKMSSLRALHKQFRDNRIKKYYFALVHGHWPSNIKMVSAPIKKNIYFKGERLAKVSIEGKKSKTYFKVEERFSIATLVRAIPITGRTHQIRVHTQYAGYPIVFDDRYGNSFFDKKIKKCGLKRLFLHAAVMHLEHPGSGEILCIEAPMDNKLLYCLEFLRKCYR